MKVACDGSVNVAYPGGSICESGLQVHDSHRLKAESYLHVTYSSGSICVSGLVTQYK